MGDTGVIPLGPEDRAILALECTTVAGHTCKVIRLAPGAPDVAGLRARVAERMRLAPALTRRLGGPPDAPGWVPDPDFAVDRHVGSGPGAEPVDAAGLLEAVAALFEQRLDRDRPLWRIDRIGLQDGGAVLVWRMHHALADGTAAMRYARALLWDRAAEAELTPTQAAAVHTADEARRRGHLAGFLRREFARERGRSPFDGAIGTRRQIGFASVALGDLHDAARALDGATLNDAVLSVLAGALGHWVQHHHGHLGEIRVRVPVSLHHEGDAAANRDSFFSVALPLNEPDPVARLHAVHAATAARKSAHDAEQMDALLHELSGVSPRMERFVVRLEDSPRRFALSVSNVHGPRDPVSVLGARVGALHSLAEIGRRHALRVAVVSLAGQLCFGFCADPDLVPDVQGMADAVVRETDALVGAVV